MSIQIRMTDYAWNGTALLSPGDTPSLDGSVAADLVNGGKAMYISERESNKEMPDVKANVDPVTGGIVFQAGAYNLDAPYVPSTRDSAGIQALVDFLSAMGGGTIRLEPATYTFTAPVILKSGVRIEGQLWINTITSNVPEDSEVLYQGTICEGDGTFAGFIGNTEDQASATTALSASGSTGARLINAFASNALQAVGLKGMALRDFTYGIKVGALNNYGLLQSSIEDLYIEDCTEWGLSLDNFQFIHVKNINAKTTINSASGCMRFGASVASSVLIPGDSWLENIWGVTNYRLNHCIRFDTNATVTNNLHNINAHRVQANRLGETSTYNSVTVNNSADIPVANCEYFPVGMPVWFKTSAGADFTYSANLNDQGYNQIYFVVSRSAASGAGNVQVANRPGASAIVTTGGSVSLRMYVGGFAGVEVENISGNYLSHPYFSQVCAEGKNNPSVTICGMSGGRVHIADHLATAVANVVLRGAVNGIVETTCGSNLATTDLDNASNGTLFLGNRSTTVAPVGLSGYGLSNGRLSVRYDPTVAGVSGVAATRTRGSTNSAQIQLVVTGAATGAICTVTLPTLNEKYNGYCPTIQPANAAAQALTGANQVRVQETTRTTGFDLVADTALPNGTYVYNVAW